MTDKVGIVGYGAYVPRYRIKVQEIAKVWGDDGDRISEGLKVFEKTIPAFDEDAATIAVEAARIAVTHAQVSPDDIGAVYVGSESHPYAVKPTATIVGEAIMATPHMTAADYEFACKAGTAAIQTSMGLVSSGRMKYAMAIGSDTSQGRPGDPLEYTASAGAGAYIIGTENLVAEILDTYSFTTDTPDFWRREREEFPSHGARFTGKPAYFRHIVAASNEMMERGGMKPEDFDYCILHQPNGKFPAQAAKMLGFTEKQLEVGLMTPWIGNTYSAAVPIGLANVLDNAKAGEMILATSFGSGAGSDSFIIRVTKENETRRNKTPVKTFIDDKVYVDYAMYAKLKKKIKELEVEK